MKIFTKNFVHADNFNDVKILSKTILELNESLKRVFAACSTIVYTLQCKIISNNNKTNNLSVNKLVDKLMLKREVLLIPNLVWRFPGCWGRAFQRDFYKNPSKFLNSKNFSYFFVCVCDNYFLMVCIFSSKYCTFSVLTA